MNYTHIAIRSSSFLNGEHFMACSVRFYHEALREECILSCKERTLEEVRNWLARIALANITPKEVADYINNFLAA